MKKKTIIELYSKLATDLTNSDSFKAISIRYINQKYMNMLIHRRATIIILIVWMYQHHVVEL